MWPLINQWGKHITRAQQNSCPLAQGNWVLVYSKQVSLKGQAENFFFAAPWLLTWWSWFGQSTSSQHPHKMSCLCICSWIDTTNPKPCQSSRSCETRLHRVERLLQEPGWRLCNQATIPCWRMSENSTGYTRTEVRQLTRVHLMEDLYSPSIHGGTWK